MECCFCKFKYKWKSNLKHKSKYGMANLKFTKQSIVWLASEMRGQQLATSYIVSASDKSDQIIQFLSLPAKANSVTDQWTLKTIELVSSIFSVCVCVYHWKSAPWANTVNHSEIFPAEIHNPSLLKQFQLQLLFQNLAENYFKKLKNLVLLMKVRPAREVSILWVFSDYCLVFFECCLNPG